MNNQEAIWYVNHTFEVTKEELCNNGRFDEATEFEIAQNMAIEALSASFIDDIYNAPTVITPTERTDNLQKKHGVDVVRCKDCVLNTVNTDGATENWCYKFGYAVEDTDFCSYGERIEE